MTATVIRLPARAFPIMWEQEPAADECAHQWESIFAEQYPEHFVEVGRCQRCHTPRCDSTDDLDTQCLERRHHSTVHIYESGSFAPLGGILPASTTGSEQP